MNERINVAAVRQGADLRQVVEHYLGAPTRQNGRGAWWRCPFHTERTASFLVGGMAAYSETYKCFGCGAHGDVLEFVRLQEHLAPTGRDFIAAVRKVAEICGLVGVEDAEGDAPVRPAAPPEPYGPPPAAWQAAAGEFCAAAAAALWSPLGAGCRRYLMERRGLNEATLREWQVGWQVGTVYQPGTRWGMPERERLWLPQGLVIPGRVVETLWYVKIRPSREVRFQAKYYQVPSPAETERMALLGVERWQAGRPVLLTEGEMDLLTVWQEGRQVVNAGTLGGARKALRGGRLHLGRWLPYLGAAERLLLAYDADTAGQEALAAWQQASARVEPVTVPFGTDVNQFHVGGGSVAGWLRAVIGKEEGGRRKEEKRREKGQEFPLTLVFPAEAGLALATAAWRRLDDGRVEATFTTREALELTLAATLACREQTADSRR